jgi:hypothetical protein
MIRMIWVVFIAVFMAPLGAFGDTMGQTNWSLAPSGGIYYWSGNIGDPLHGAHIGVSTVTGVGTEANNGTTLAISYGSLGFASGPYDGTPGSTWSWGAGGVFGVEGCIEGVTDVNCAGNKNVLLLGGNFTSISIVPVVPLGKYSFDVMFGRLTGQLNPAVASYFGLSDSFSATSLSLLFTSSNLLTGGPGSGFIGTDICGGISATSSVAVAEGWDLSSTLAAFALAAVAFGAVRRLGSSGAPIS